MISFVKLYFSFIPNFAAFHSKFVSHERMVTGTFYSALLSLVNITTKEGAEHKLPLLAIAFLEAEYTCPSTKVTNKMCNFIAKSDIDACCRKRLELAIEGEKVLSVARQML